MEMKIVFIGNSYMTYWPFEMYFFHRKTHTVRTSVSYTHLTLPTNSRV